MILGESGKINLLREGTRPCMPQNFFFCDFEQLWGKQYLTKKNSILLKGDQRKKSGFGVKFFPKKLLNIRLKVFWKSFGKKFFFFAKQQSFFAKKAKVDFKLEKNPTACNKVPTPLTVKAFQCNSKKKRKEKI